MRSTCYPIVLSTVIIVITMSGAGARTAESGQSTPPAQDASLAATVEKLIRTIEAQQKQIEEQGRQIQRLQEAIAEARAPSPGATVPAAPTAAMAPAPAAAVSTGAPPTGAELDQRRASELPPDVVSAGEFPGSIKLPGSDAALRIGGLVRVNWVTSYNALLVDDRFQTSAIPAAGSPDSQRGGRVSVIASPSRFNFDLRTPTGVGYMRSFIEGDFAGSGNSLRLRHAYGQWRRLIFGQTWSTFSDPEAEPDGIDFEGLNAIVLFRQPQIRWSFPLSPRIRMAVALEDPDPDLTGANGVNQVPDFVSRVRWEPDGGGHIQVAGLVRQLRGEPADQANRILAAGGYGVSVSGRLPVRYWSRRDQFLFQHNNGYGIGRYVADLRSLGGQDAVFDSAAEQLRPLGVLSGYIGYEHWWAERLRSAFSFGIVRVNNLDIQAGSALNLTTRSSINFIWSPIQRLDMVTEFLWGERRNKDGTRGRAAQTQVGSTFRF
jgi:hypothetical protein